MLIKTDSNGRIFTRKKERKHIAASKRQVGPSLCRGFGHTIPISPLKSQVKTCQNPDFVGTNQHFVRRELLNHLLLAKIRRVEGLPFGNFT